jgi:sec-independent protein translocase protein TatB
VGPKDLPRLMRMVGRWVGKARAMADQFKSSFDEMARETELDELRAEIEAIRRNNPLTQAQEELNRAILPPGGPALPPATPAADVPDAEAAELGDATRAQIGSGEDAADGQPAQVAPPSSDAPGAS